MTNKSLELSFDNYHDTIDYVIAGIYESGYGEQLAQTSIEIARLEKKRSNPNVDSNLTDVETAEIITKRVNVVSKITEKRAFRPPAIGVDEPTNDYLNKVTIAH